MLYFWKLFAFAFFVTKNTMLLKYFNYEKRIMSTEQHPRQAEPIYHTAVEASRANYRTFTSWHKGTFF